MARGPEVVSRADVWRRLVIACAVAVAVCETSQAQQPVVFEDVKVRFSKGATDRPLVNKDAELILDDSAECDAGQGE